MSQWEVQKLTDMYAVHIARGIPTARTMPEGEVPVRSVASLIGDKEITAFADIDDVEDVGALTSESGDVLIAIEGGSIGESFFVTQRVPVFVPSQQAVTLRPVDSAILIPEYFAAWVASSECRQQLQRLARGGGIQRIALSDLMSLAVPLPPIEVQEHIGSRFLMFIDAIAEHRRVLDYLTELQEVEMTGFFANQGTDEPLRETKGTRSA